MASIWKHPNSPFWAACFDVHSPVANLRWKRSVKTRDRKLAQRIADHLELVGRASLDEHEIVRFYETIPDLRVRRITKNIFSDVFRITAGRELGGASLSKFVESWLARLRTELAPQSLDKYEQISRDLLAFIGPAARRDVTSFSARDDILVIGFRDHLAARLAPSTVNTSMKIVRQLFKAAAIAFKIESPAQHVSGVNKRHHAAASAATSRRPFTLQEIGRALKVARGSEWEGIILAGFYTAGQRLSDIATLRWENIDLLERELAFTSRKTGRRIVLPLAEPFSAYLESLPAGDDPKAFVFPNAAGHIARAKSEQSATLSNQFYDILARAGLVRRRTHEKAKDGSGRSSRRVTSEISFHSFRHTATSLLKNAGIPRSIVMDVVGHESSAISQIYTHADEGEKQRAIDALPSLSALMQTGAPAAERKGKQKKNKRNTRRA